MQRNIIKFEPLVDLDIEVLEPSTKKAIMALAARAGKTPEQIIRDALDEFIASYEIGDKLLSFLRSLSANRTPGGAIEIWEKQIQSILNNLGGSASSVPPHAT